MKRICRETHRWRSRRLEELELVRRIKVITDPERVAKLKAELESKKIEERQQLAICHSRPSGREDSAK
jgi:hypothetical protein